MTDWSDPQNATRCPSGQRSEAVWRPLLSGCDVKRPHHLSIASGGLIGAKKNNNNNKKTGICQMQTKAWDSIWQPIHFNVVAHLAHTAKKFLPIWPIEHAYFTPCYGTPTIHQDASANQNALGHSTNDTVTSHFSGDFVFFIDFIFFERLKDHGCTICK